MSSEKKSPEDEALSFEEKLKNKDRHSHLGTEAAAVATGAAAGALIGAVAGPPGAIAGAVVGGVVGAVAGVVLDKEEIRREEENMEMDRQSVMDDEVISRHAKELREAQKEEEKRKSVIPPPPDGEQS